MGFVRKISNGVIPLISFFVAIIFLPLFLFFKFLNSLVKPCEDVAGKVVLITGASSGIGEHLAYEYAKRGSCLALVARRENLLREVAEKARRLGAADVIVIRGDVSRVDDCKRVVNNTITHFGRLNHLVNNAGIAPDLYFEDYTDINIHSSTMSINFWGPVYMTHFAIPHLKRSKGKIIIISSCAGLLPSPILSIYSASKAAVIAFYETLRIEVGSDIGITIVTPGLVDSEITTRDFLARLGAGNLQPIPTEECAKAILKSCRRGEGYLTVPGNIRGAYLLKVLCPELLEWLYFFRHRTGSNEQPEAFHDDSNPSSSSLGQNEEQQLQVQNPSNQRSDLKLD